MKMDYYPTEGMTAYEKLEKMTPSNIDELIQQWLTINEQVEMIKYKLGKVMFENNIDKWETDYFTLSLIYGHYQRRADVKKMHETKVFVTNSETGELEEVNAFDYFSKSVHVNESVRMKIKE